LRFEVLTLFPDLFPGPLGRGVTGRALSEGTISLEVHDLRDFTHDRHRQVDDVPYGGGVGMVLKPEPIFEAVQSRSSRGPVILLSPAGRLFNQSLARELSHHEDIYLICGRYEGIDERVSSIVDDQLSIGDYVLTGGELAAMVVIDAVSRLLPSVLGDEQSAQDDSFQSSLLEYPQYTRPAVFQGMAVPDVLLSGHHAEIERWRRAQAAERTRRWRPDLLSS
jgi:tRNA (guanine37-N1)-methyltransferase